MQIKKYPQSNVVVTKGSDKIVVDPGYITFEKGFVVGEFADADAFLITHQHADHLDRDHAKELFVDRPVFANFDVVAVLASLGIRAEIVKDRQIFRVAGFEIEAVSLSHCKMADGSAGPPNTGYLINGVFFHPGDGIELSGLSSPNLALPIAGPTINFENATKFAKSLAARVVIPIHYDYFKADPAQFAQKVAPLGIEVRPLVPGEETTI